MRLVAGAFATFLASLAVAILYPEARCCLTLDACDRCVVVERLPSAWRAKSLLVSNPCPKTQHIKVRYFDEGGQMLSSPWQTIAAKSDAYLNGEDGNRLVSYGGVYFYKVYSTSPQMADAGPPASLDYKSVNIFNQLSAWGKDTTRFSVYCER